MPGRATPAFELIDAAPDASSGTTSIPFLARSE
jgi:hypothetical protein